MSKEFIDLSQFDAERFFQDNDIQIYDETNKNVSRGWIGLSCPWCGDTSNHLGLELNTKVMHCFRCKKNTNIIGYMKYALDLEWSEIKSLIDEYGSYSPSIKPEDDFERPSRFKIPEHVSADVPPIFKKYMRKRGFSDSVFKKYNLHTAVRGDYAWRICIPIVMEGVIVGMTCRSIRGNAKLRYKETPDRKNVIAGKHWIFNYDRIKSSKIICVEGSFDAMKLGDNTIASLSSEDWSGTRLMLLKRKSVKKAVVLFDSGEIGFKKAESVAGNLAAVIQDVSIASIKFQDLSRDMYLPDVTDPNDFDPGMLTFYGAEKIKRELLT